MKATRKKWQFQHFKVAPSSIFSAVPQTKNKSTPLHFLDGLNPPQQPPLTSIGVGWGAGLYGIP